MREFKYVITDPEGIHARPAGDLVKEAKKYECKITLTKDGVKILGNGEITKKLTVQANKFSASAKEKIEAAGGKAEVI